MAVKSTWLLSMPESALMANIIKAARLYGWMVAHFRAGMTRRGRWVTPVQGDGKGFPDLILVHREWRQLMVIECKSERGKLEREQETWLECFAMVCETMVVRPSNYDDCLALLAAKREFPEVSDG